MSKFTLKNYILFPLLFLLPCSVYSTELKSSPDSIKILLEVTQTKANTEKILQPVVESVMTKIKTDLKTALKEKFKDKQLTQQQEEMIKTKLSQAVSMLTNELSWNVVEPILVKIYSEEFTPEEINGMVEFYSTPAGKASITKLPAIMQKGQAEMMKHNQETFIKVGNLLKELDAGL